MPPLSYSRRAFVATLTGAGTALMLRPLAARAKDHPADLAASTLGIDAHNHVDVPLTAGEAVPEIDLAGELARSGLAAISMTFAVDYQSLTRPDEGYERFKRGLDATDQILKRNGLDRARNLAEIRAAHRAKRPTVIQSVEGGHFLEGHIERLEEAHARGLRHLGLLHDNDAAVPLGDIYTKPARFGGLTAFGAEVIRASNRLGLLVDLTHASAETVTMALKIATKPVILSHTGLDTRLGTNPTFAAMMRPRLMSREQAREVAAAGAVIGVWTHLADTPLDYARNVQALVEIVGIDQVCLGTDSKLTPSRAFRGGPPPGGPKSGEGDKPRDGGEKRGGPPPRAGERTNQLWPEMTAGFYLTVVAALQDVGFSPEDIAKVGGENYLRVFGAATG